MDKFSDLKYERPDLKKISKELKKSIREIKSAEDFESFEKAFKKAEAVYVDFYTVNTLVSIRNDINKQDAFYEEERKFLTKNSTPVQMALVKMYKAVLSSPFRKQFDEKYGDFLTKKISVSLKLTNLRVLLDEVKEKNLAEEYSKIAAGCSVEFRGEQCNFYGLLKHMESTDREERRAAFNEWAGLYESVSGRLDELYDKLVALRIKKAKHAGYSSFIDYIYLARDRYDYTSKEAEQFRNNVRDIIVPVCAGLYEKQRQRLGIDTLRYYDESLIFPEGNAHPIGSKDELVEKALHMYEEMSPQTGEYFNFMKEHELFDLETRPGKRLGGYCTVLPKYKAPFIFSNFNGTSADVDVLTHEAGHAFQCYTAMKCQQTLLNVSSTSEINEIHSMSMEHFAYPWMKNFFGDATDKYLYAHLVSSLTTIPYLVAVDEFQHRVFENPKMTAEGRRKAWKKIEEIYLPWRSYDGNDFLEGGGFWMQKQHIFLYPFYYIDYALAQVCAYQFFIASRENKTEAWDRYLKLCRMGGAFGYFDLLEKSGLQNPFQKETMQSVIDKISSVIQEFEKNIER